MEATVRCPSCGRRLFDLIAPSPVSGVLRIKCPKCKALDVLDLSAYNNPNSQDHSDPASPKAPEPTP